MIPCRLVLATGNPGKVRELGALIAEWGAVQVESLADHPGGMAALPEETGATYADNARLKATVIAAAVGAPALADDSGLEVDALGGAPGVHSARYAPTDADRIARLLHALDGVPEPRRTARFRCVVVLAEPAGRTTMAEGVCEGRILPAPSGAGGFGYDPIFWSEALAAPLGVVALAEKQRISHRAVAVRNLGRQLGAPAPER